MALDMLMRCKVSPRGRAAKSGEGRGAFNGSDLSNRSARAAWPALRASPLGQGARHEGVERGPELSAVAILLHHDLVARAGDDEMRAGAQADRELLDGRRRHDHVLAGGDDQQRLADTRR